MTVTDTGTQNAGAQHAGAAQPSDELLPFLNNFHDIFTTIGVVILFAGLGLGAVQVFGAVDPGAGTLIFDGLWLALAAGVALAAWGVSAVLVGRQRRILPGIALSVVFAACAGGVLVYLYTRLTFGVVDPEAIGAAFDSVFADGEPSRATVQAALAEIPLAARVWPVGLGVIISAVVALYYLSFKLPFAGGLTGLALVWTGLAVLAVIDPYTAVIFNPLASLAAGLALFVAGIVFDARDPARTTRLSGTGFWLHFFAAPTLLSAAVSIANTGISLSPADFEGGGGLFGALIEGDSASAIRSAVVTLAVIVVFALISLLINRRALIVSGLITAGIAMGVLVNQLGLGSGAVIAVTLLLLGGLVVLLGAAWNPVRRVLVAPFPDAGPLARIFPPARAGDAG